MDKLKALWKVLRDLYDAHLKGKPRALAIALSSVIVTSVVMFFALQFFGELWFTLPVLVLLAVVASVSYYDLRAKARKANDAMYRKGYNAIKAEYGKDPDFLDYLRSEVIEKDHVDVDSIDKGLLVEAWRIFEMKRRHAKYPGRHDLRRRVFKGSFFNPNHPEDVLIERVGSETGNMIVNLCAYLAIFFVAALQGRVLFEGLLKLEEHVDLYTAIYAMGLTGVVLSILVLVNRAGIFIVEEYDLAFLARLGRVGASLRPGVRFGIIGIDTINPDGEDAGFVKRLDNDMKLVDSDEPVDTQGIAARRDPTLGPIKVTCHDVKVDMKLLTGKGSGKSPDPDASTNAKLESLGIVRYTDPLVARWGVKGSPISIALDIYSLRSSEAARKVAEGDFSPVEWYSICLELPVKLKPEVQKAIDEGHDQESDFVRKWKITRRQAQQRLGRRHVPGNDAKVWAPKAFIPASQMDVQTRFRIIQLLSNWALQDSRKMSKLGISLEITDTEVRQPDNVETARNKLAEARFNARATVATADGEAQAIRKVGDAKAAAERARLNARAEGVEKLGEITGDPASAAQLVHATIATEEIDSLQVIAPDVLSSTGMVPAGAKFAVGARAGKKRPTKKKTPSKGGSGSGGTSS